MTVAYESVERYVHVCHVEQVSCHTTVHSNATDDSLNTISLQTDLAGPKSCHKLHLHIGVSALQPFLLLERRARRSGYERLDVKDCPAPCLADDTGRKGFGVTHEWDNEALPDELFTNLPLDEINSRLSARWGDRLRLSSNAGKLSLSQLSPHEWY